MDPLNATNIEIEELKAKALKQEKIIKEKDALKVNIEIDEKKFWKLEYEYEVKL